MVFDCHAHIASSKTLPISFVKGMVNNLVASMPKQLEKKQEEYLQKVIYQLMNHDDEGEMMIEEMNKAEISKSVLLIIDYGIVFPDDFPVLEEVFQLHRRVLEKYPDRFIVFSGIDPRRGKKGLDLFEKSIKEWRFKGLKLYPPCGFNPSDPIVFPFYEIAQKYQIPVLLHTGPTSPSLPFKYSAPELIDEAAYRFPKVNFILAHAAFMMHEQASILAEYRPNIYLDVSGFTNAIRMERFKSILLEHKKRGILNKVLFGTDWPIHRLNGNQKDLVEMFRTKAEEVLTSEEIENIMYNNIHKIIKPN
ncbi:amidohydrolase family protein [Aquimarina sediminis]|uniref:amidohydrolase family protein n=1 Tax=Aquimarina sediminis TaxID=2070536 RepID=UPI000CA0346A|nr:amidohydrolase family protein [Aquimarina sediminis]